MALLWIDGFENYGTSTGVPPSPTGVMGRKYSGIVYEGQVDIETGRLGGYCIELPYTDIVIKPPNLTTDDTLVVGAAVYFNSVSISFRFLEFMDGATLGMNLRMAPTGELAVYRGATLLATTSGLGLSSLTWYFIEFKVVCDNTTGSYEVKVGESTVLSASGVDTQAGSNPYHTTFQLHGENNGAPKFDDLYCVDGSGATRNDFLGNNRVITIRPSGAGDSTDFTPSAGSNYECVDEVTCDDDTSYVEDDTAAQKDLYAYSDLSIEATIFGIMVNTDCRETDATSYDIITVCKSGSTEDPDSGQAIGTTNYITKSRIIALDPNTSSNWTKTTLDAAQFGMEVG